MEVACGAAEEQTPPEGGVAKLTETVPSPPQNVAPGLTLEGLKVETKVAAVRNVKKDIPAKKDRLEPLKIDMTKHFLLPPTSAQLSLQCLECHIIFSDHKSKERHLKQSHPAEYEQCMLGDALFACYVCDRHFTCSTELMAHQRAHTEKQPFKCPICGEAFRRSSELTIHKKVHFGLHGYTCADCGKPCKTLTLLKYHQRTHTGERPYVCKDCGKRFSMSKALQKHLLTHTAEEADGDGGGAVLLTPTGEATHIKRLGASSQGESFGFVCIFLAELETNTWHPWFHPLKCP
ncbi:zinc finger protein 502-like isoform X3 [Anguilla rostrata]|uniref:zinc finger protein 502-like isoform X3 n=1 Tax=Anguilla rostrata TaxID=7938 RepID=UPI0030D2E94C